MYKNQNSSGFITIPILIAIVFGATVIAGTGGYYVANQIQKTEPVVSENSTNYTTQVSDTFSSSTISEAIDLQTVSTTSDTISVIIEDDELKNANDYTEPEITSQKLPATTPITERNEIPAPVTTPIVIDYQEICTEEAELEYQKYITESEQFIESNKLKIETEVSNLEKIIRETEAEQRRLVSQTRDSYDTLIEKEEDYYESLIQAQKTQNIISGTSRYSPAQADSLVQDIESERDAVISDYERQKEQAVKEIRNESAKIIEGYEDAINRYESQTAEFSLLAEEEANKVRESHFKSCMTRG